MSQQTMTTNGYFRPGLFRFLKDLKTHNERAWFQANKQRYEADVQEPFLRLIADLSPALKKIGGGFIADPSPKGGSMMRIYRDIRFSKDKSPLRRRALLACEWQRRGRSGIFPSSGTKQLRDRRRNLAARPKALKKLRDKIAGDPKGWGRATTGGVLGSTCRMAGESLKRPPAGYDPAHPFIEDIKRKDFAISTPLTDREVTGDDFLDLVLHRLRATAPFVQFLSNAVGLP